MKRRLLVVLTSVALACAMGCRMNPARITSSMKDADRNAVVQERFCIGMPSSEVVAQLNELRVDWDWGNATPYPMKSKNDRTIRAHVFPAGILRGFKDPAPSAPLTFYMDEEARLSRVTYLPREQSWRDRDEWTESVIPLAMCESSSEPAP